MELQDGHCTELRSKMDPGTTPEEFVKAVEKFRRERAKRVFAGDESANLTFPRKAPGPAKAGAPGKGGPPAKAKAEAKSLKAAVKPTAKGAPPAAAQDAPKRPVTKAATDESDNEEHEPATKKPRNDGGVPAPFGKANVAKAPVAKSPVTKAISKAPVAKAPVAKAPVAKSKPA